MAKFESMGYCPHNYMRFHFGEKGIFAKRVLEIIGDRDGFMVYKPGHIAKEHYSTDMLLGGGDSTLGIEVSTILRELIPECVYPSVGDRIWIYDVINPLQIPEGCKSLEDDRYLVGIMKDDDVHMYIYQK